MTAESWDALAGDDDPFAEHAFLLAMERSRTTSAETGWAPSHVTVWDGARMVGAVAAYVKTHSYGEFIFDWGWADAAAQLGVPYYPKVVSMAPVTPATGRRILIAPQADRVAVARVLGDGLMDARDRARASSIHLLFLRDDERALLAEDARFLPRVSSQFHWNNAGYGTFDDFTATFRSAMRKQVRKERAAVDASGVTIEVLEGPALTARDVDAIHTFYLDTCERKGSPPYLLPAFFDELLGGLRRRVVVAIARRGGAPVAASLNFEKGKVLYGRYWGCVEELDSLHFELCFYRLLERAIERKYDRFEAGAQGIHKLRRGLLPVRIHSAHHVRDERLARAIAAFLPREAAAVERQIAELAEHGPFRRG